MRMMKMMKRHLDLKMRWTVSNMHNIAACNKNCIINNSSKTLDSAKLARDRFSEQSRQHIVSAIDMADALV